jgi:hypothetical protein
MIRRRRYVEGKEGLREGRETNKSLLRKRIISGHLLLTLKFTYYQF